MIDSLHEGIIIFNQNFEILYQNNSVLKIFGIDNQNRQEAISLKVLDLKIYKLDKNKSPELIKSLPNKKQVFD